MRLTIISKTKDEIVVEVAGETIGFVNALREELWNDPNVVEAAYLKDHPYLDEPKIFVKVSKGDPKTALKNAVKRLKEKVKEMSKALERELG